MICHIHNSVFIQLAVKDDQCCKNVNSQLLPSSSKFPDVYMFGWDINTLTVWQNVIRLSIIRKIKFTTIISCPQINSRIWNNQSYSIWNWIKSVQANCTLEFVPILNNWYSYIPQCQCMCIDIKMLGLYTIYLHRYLPFVNKCQSHI